MKKNLLVSIAIVFAISFLPLTAQAFINDGAHNGGSTNFFFLPPMVDNPNVTGTFDSTLNPVVEVLDLQEGTAIATFTNAGKASEKLRVNSKESSYIVNWHTGDFSLDTTKTYRIQISTGNALLGFADVAVVGSAKELRNVDTTQFIPLLKGTTLPIKFSIVQKSSTPVPTSCKEINDLFPAAADGIYTIEPVLNAPIQVHCLMSSDGGGWTLVANFPWPGNTNGVTGWTSGGQINTSFTDLAQAFKLSDSSINTLKTVAYRSHGSANMCLQGTCSVDTTLYWKASCQYSSGSLGTTCGDAYLDPALTIRDSNVSDSSACTWHWGLVASNCYGSGGSEVAEMGTSHDGDHVFVGAIGSFIHAYDGRTGENPSIQVWVK